MSILWHDHTIGGHEHFSHTLGWVVKIVHMFDEGFHHHGTFLPLLQPHPLVAIVDNYLTNDFYIFTDNNALVTTDKPKTDNERWYGVEDDSWLTSRVEFPGLSTPGSRSAIVEDQESGGIHQTSVDDTNDTEYYRSASTSQTPDNGLPRGKPPTQYINQLSGGKDFI